MTYGENAMKKCFSGICSSKKDKEMYTKISTYANVDRANFGVFRSKN